MGLAGVRRKFKKQLNKKTINCIKAVSIGTAFFLLFRSQ